MAGKEDVSMRIALLAATFGPLLLSDVAVPKVEMTNGRCYDVGTMRGFWAPLQLLHVLAAVDRDISAGHERRLVRA